MIEYGLGGGSEQLRARTGGRFQQLVTRPDPIHAAPRHREQVRPGRGKSRVDLERERRGAHRGETKPTRSYCKSSAEIFSRISRTDTRTVDAKLGLGRRDEATSE
jgi:hypothetical protein